MSGAVYIYLYNNIYIHINLYFSKLPMATWTHSGALMSPGPITQCLNILLKSFCSKGSYRFFMDFMGFMGVLVFMAFIAFMGTFLRWGSKWTFLRWGSFCFEGIWTLGRRKILGKLGLLGLGWVSRATFLSRCWSLEPEVVVRSCCWFLLVLLPLLLLLLPSLLLLLLAHT